ncbi:hypothetical protein L2E82_15163 [Cichorium intybus]|uniref:Uncharacterized protein n=1 Tax=Cichorium intybus TaxID=13427 RepID=A0ACB9F1Z3_CICIN|nr:hypothetical protein L2E82_15163 [Cichorium intybus]
MTRIDRAMFASCVFMVSLLVMVSMVDSSRGIISGIGFGPACTQVVGVNDGDTCFAIEQGFNLTSSFFDSINPNLNCTALFIGQWLCIAGIGG